MSTAQIVGASLVRAYFPLEEKKDRDGLSVFYSADSKLLEGDKQSVGGPVIVDLHVSRLTSLARFKLELKSVDSIDGKDGQIIVSVVGTYITPTADHHFVRGFLLQPTLRREKTYYIAAEWHRETAVILDRVARRAAKEEASAQAPKQQAPAAPAVVPQPVAPAVVPQVQQPARQQPAPSIPQPKTRTPPVAPAKPTTPAPRPAAGTSSSNKTTAPAAAAAPAAAPAPAAVPAPREERAKRERRPRQRALCAVVGLGKRITLGDIRQAVEVYGKVLQLKRLSPTEMGIEFTTLRGQQGLIAATDLTIGGKVVSGRLVELEEYERVPGAPQYEAPPRPPRGAAPAAAPAAATQ